MCGLFSMGFRNIISPHFVRLAMVHSISDYNIHNHEWQRIEQQSKAFYELGLSLNLSLHISTYFDWFKIKGANIER